jgi:FkbM family methyltransferase
MSVVPSAATDIAALFAEFRDPQRVDAFGPFDPPQFGILDSAPDTTAEMASLLWSVRTAGQRYRLISLGAAPGEWALRAERAYRKRYPNGDYISFNLEADPDHAEMTRQFLTNNHADLESNLIISAVVAEKNGWAYFPVINSEADWGAGIAALSDRPDDLDDKVEMTEIARQDRIHANGGKPLEFRTVRAFSLRSVLDHAGEVDFLHSDIQGSEGAVLTADMAAISERVRICCIATHGTEIEEALLDAFAQHGWSFDCGFPCVMHNDRVMRDGTFVWSNPRMDRHRLGQRIKRWLTKKKSRQQGNELILQHVLSPHKGLGDAGCKLR